MSRVTVRIEDGHVLWDAPETGEERRPLREDDSDRFRDWSGRYRRLLRVRDRAAGLLELGREIYA